MNRCIVWGVLCLAPCSVLAQAPPALNDGDGPVEIHGHILPSDDKDVARQQPRKIHPLYLQKDRTYLVDMKSNDFDSYLRIVDQKHKALAEDDDGGDGSNARLRFLAPADGVYLFIATSCGGGQGAYQLSLRPLTPPAPLAMAAPKAGEPSRMAVVLTQLDAVDAERNQPAKTYSVKLEAGISYVIDLRSKDCDAFLSLADAKGKKLAENDDGSDGVNSRLRFTPPETATYRLIASTLGLQGQKGNLDLIVTQSGKPLRVNMNKVFEVAKEPVLLDGELNAGDAKDKSRQNSYCQVHKFKLKSGKTYVVDMMSNHVDCYLRLEDSKGKMLAEDDDGGEGTNSRVEVTPTNDDEFRIITTTLGDNEVGAYSLQVREK